MSSEKVVLPKDVAEAITKLRQGASDGEIMVAAVKGVVVAGLWDECAILWKYAKESADHLMNALVNGYEIERSPEDRIRAYIKSSIPCPIVDSDTIYYEKIGRRIGVRDTLNILGITIEGVND